MSSLFKLKVKSRFRSKSMNSTKRREIKSNEHPAQSQRRRGSDAEVSSRNHGVQGERSHEIISSESSTDSGMVLSPETAISSPGMEENVLADDLDGFAQRFSGRLTFTENPPSPDAKEFTYEVPCDGTSAISMDITFEVISAEVIRDGRSGHVTYTILINPHKESAKISPTVIKRRYSDFENLHHALKKRFSSIMSNISFPRKVLMGNFTSETIAKRSTAFEQYLTHLYSMFEVRYSRVFMEFFVTSDLQAAVNFFLERKYSNCVPLLEKVVPILEKLYGNFHILVCQCLSCLVVCYTQLDQIKAAHSCAEVALKCCLPESSAADDELRFAILTSAITLCWKLGIDKRELETRLEAMQSEGFNLEKARDLREVLQKAIQTTFPG